jgi:hypothetical protein
VVGSGECGDEPLGSGAMKLVICKVRINYESTKTPLYVTITYPLYYALKAEDNSINK